MSHREIQSALKFMRISNPACYVKDNLRALKEMPSAWADVLQNKDADEFVRAFITHNVRPNLPRANLKKILGFNDYTLVHSIRNKSAFITHTLLDNFKIHPKLLNYSIVLICSQSSWDGQVDILNKMIKGSELSKITLSKAMLNISACDNGAVVDVLLKAGGVLINKHAALAYLSFKNITPYDALMDIPVENHAAIVCCLDISLATTKQRLDDLDLLNYLDEK